MPSPSTLNIVLIGAGNLGYHLGLRLKEKGHEVAQVFSRERKKAGHLARAIGSSYTTSLQKISPKADIYILAVHDSAIGEVAATLSQVIPTNSLVVHTSGATPSTVLASSFQHYGIFYPLQTFSIDKPADYEQIPICVDAAMEEDLEQLEAFAKSLSPKTYRIDDQQRAILHVAAVFVNNFSNHLFQIGADILEREAIPFDLLRPLIAETADKVQSHAPQQMQTGPAIRGDETTLKQHLDYLKKYPDYARLYALLSKGINPNLSHL